MKDEIKMGVSIVEDVAVKTCPFWGSEANLKTDSGFLSTLFWVKFKSKSCGICGISSGSRSVAVEAWETRAS